MKIGLVQAPVSMDKKENLQNALTELKKLKQQGAELVIFSEMFNCPYSNLYFADYAEEEGGETWRALSGAAMDNQVYLVAGSIPEKEAGRVYNTSFVFDPSGRQLTKHRKVHLFDIDVKGGQRFFESETFTPGNQVTTFSMKGITVGLCICFDFRFPELSRLMALQGAQIIVVPAAFNMTTGPAHWETTWRQRAVDNQVYTIGVAPARDEQGVYVSYGNSIVCSPWGDVLYRAEEKPVSAVVELDLERVSSVREQLPLLKARRTDLYDVVAR